MIVRIVKLQFKSENIPVFKDIFEETKTVIRNYKGCMFLEMYQDIQDPSLFFTYSHWNSEEHLNAYRHSDFFKEVWSRTKVLFSDRPQAWSVQKIHKENLS